jgi:membrane fusion protein, multidrug efflux system
MKKNFFIVCMILTACSQHKIPQNKPSYPVTIALAETKDIPYFIKGVGQLVPSLSANIKAQVSGILTSVTFEDGKMVEEGDLLMTIDSRIFEANVMAAQAQLDQDKARLSYAKDFAETYGSLVGKQYVARLDYEQGVQNVDVAKAAIEKDLAALKQAQVNLDYTELRAPFKGYLGLRTYDPGNFVNAPAGQTLVTVNKITPLCVLFFLSSTYLQQIREKQEENPLYLEAILPADPEHPLVGSLWFIDNTVNPQTGMIRLEGNIPNLDERGWPGQFVRVFLRLDILQDAVFVPLQAVVVGESGHYLYVLNEETMTVSVRMIGKGIVYQNQVVIEWGLKPGEKVITDGQLNLYEGAPVHLFHEEVKTP